MIRVLGSEVLETCLDSSVVKELRVSQPLDETAMRRMAVQGKLQYFPHFPRPYFRIDRSGIYVVQGVLGNLTLRVTFSPRAGVDAEEQLKTFIETALPGEGND